MRFFGAHVSASGGLENALSNGEALGVNTIQIHPSPPQRWNGKAFPEGAESKFVARFADSSVKKVFFHGIYLINLANPKPEQFHLSKTSLAHYLDLAARVKAEGVIFHVGSLKDQPDEAAGFAQVAQGIDWALENSPPSSRLILEVAAGSGSIIGDRMEELAAIYDLVKGKDRVGFGLDTQHMWASGYDLQNSLETIVDDIERLMNLSKVWAIHMNDSKTALASRTDRHENFGDGLIGHTALEKVLNHPRLKNIPIILETPALKDMETAKKEICKVQALLRD